MINIDDDVMQTLQYILLGQPYNTRLSQVGGSVYIEEDYKLSNGKFPALLLEVGKQLHTVQGTNVYEATLNIICTYYDRWDQTMVPIDTIRRNIKSDLMVMMGNVQANPGLQKDGSSHGSLQKIQLDPYRGSLDEKTIPGLTLVKRAMTLTINVLPYDVF